MGEWDDAREERNTIGLRGERNKEKKALKFHLWLSTVYPGGKFPKMRDIWRVQKRTTEIQPTSLTKNKRFWGEGRGEKKICP